MKYLKTMLGLLFLRGFQLWSFCGRQDKGFGKLAKRASLVDESTALPIALDGTKEVELSYYTAITLYQDFSDISPRPSGRSWKEARKAECEFSRGAHKSAAPSWPASWTLWKDHYVFGFSPNVCKRKAPHPVFFANFPGCHTTANCHGFVGWRGEIMKGKGLL